MAAQNTFVYTHIGPLAIVFAFPIIYDENNERICMIAPSRSIHCTSEIFFFYLACFVFPYNPPVFCTVP